MKLSLSLLFLFIAFNTSAQNAIIDDYKKATDLLKNEKALEAYKIYKVLASKIDKSDTLYEYVLWYYTTATSQLVNLNKMNEDWEQMLTYSKEVLLLIEEGKEFFDDKFAQREYWTTKNLIVAYFGLNQLKEAKKLQNNLYKAYKKGSLPDGIDKFYNFEFFKWENLNIWGYEWFEELPKDRLGSSFSKMVYYVYSTNEDGSDKEQLYRLHVLMFHKIDNSVKFDYVLTKRIETATGEAGGTLYSYTYKNPVDFEKLRMDIREVLKGNLKPDTQSIIRKKK